MKRIAMFLDGTWNDPDHKTNVCRLFDATLEERDVQSKRYWKGVGVKWTERLRGGVLGYGLTQNVREAYHWLTAEYEDGDEIYLFGFSRGAYTARSIAGIIINCGLLRHACGMTVDDIFARYEAGKEKRAIFRLDYLESTNPSALDEEEKRLLACSRRVPIKMVGVWDTVGSMGIPWTEFPGIGRGNYYFLNTNISNLIQHAYHALAVDEHRGPYKPTLWTKFFPETITPNPPYVAAGQVVEQRWFPGAHANVGGGYGDEDRLGWMTLAWMQEKAKACGLQFTSPLSTQPDDFKGEPQDSYAEFMHGFYRFLRLGMRYYRPIGAGPRVVKNGKSVPITEVIDASVFRRYQNFPKYRPKNLREWSKRKGVDPAQQKEDAACA